MNSRALSLIAWVGVLIGGVAPAAAGELELPQDPRGWFNSPPISLQAMRGKSVF